MRIYRATKAHAHLKVTVSPTFNLPLAMTLNIRRQRNCKRIDHVSQDGIAYSMNSVSQSFVIFESSEILFQILSTEPSERNP